MFLAKILLIVAAQTKLHPQRSFNQENEFVPKKLQVRKDLLSQNSWVGLTLEEG